LKSDPLVIVVDSREQRPLDLERLGVAVERGTIGEGDYAARGFEAFARVERKSSADLWGTVHAGHERFNRELARLGDIPRIAILVDDAWSPAEVADRMQASPKDRLAFFGVIRALAWKPRIPIVWGGNREAAALWLVWALRSVVEDYAPERLARCDEIARLAGPYSSGAALRAAALAAGFGICAACGRRPGSRPKPPGPGICACGRKAA
jgi:hypothetical protein